MHNASKDQLYKLQRAKYLTAERLYCEITLQKLKCANLATNYEQGRTPPLKDVPDCGACQLRL